MRTVRSVVVAGALAIAFTCPSRAQAERQQPAPNSAQTWVARALSDPGDTFNGAIAALTMILAATGMYQAWIARDTARRQLRAYVHIVDLRLDYVAPFARPSAAFNMRNAGQTPALDVGVMFSIALLPLPSEERYFGRPDVIARPEPGNSKGPLGAGDTQPIHLTFPDPLPEDLFARFRAGELGFFVYGDITYRDVFGRKQFSRVRFVHDAKSRPGMMHLASRGNSAT